MPKPVLLPLSFILWERLKEREMRRKALFSMAVISFKFESSNILSKIEEVVNGWKSPDSHVLYSVVPLTCFVTFGSYFKPPFLHLPACKMGEPPLGVCRGLAANFRITVRRIYIRLVTNGKGNVVLHARA